MYEWVGLEGERGERENLLVRLFGMDNGVYVQSSSGYSLIYSTPKNLKHINI